jgi:WD40 repeat protein
MRRQTWIGAFLLGIASLSPGWTLAQETTESKAIQPVEPKLNRPIDFEKDIYPILDAKCLACHNVAINENGLVLEDVKAILKGGKRGPSVVAKDPTKSLLYTMSSRGTGPAMPPLPNKVEAAAVTPEELGLIRQWILEGANAGAGTGGSAINWQPLPKGVHPIYSVALSHDGQYAVAGRGNKVVLYHVPTGETLADLGDPALAAIQYNGKPMYEPGASHRDYVHSLAISPTGNMIASGSFREVKLWARPDNWQRLALPASGGVVPALAVSPDGQWIAAAAADFSIKIFKAGDANPAKTLAGHTATVSSLAFSPEGTKLYSASHDKSIRGWNLADGTPAGRLETPAAVYAIALTIDGTKVIAGCADNLLRVFTSPSAAAALSTAAAPVPFVRVSPDRKTLALAEADGKITLIDLATGKVAKQLAGHAGAVNAVAFHANSAKIASAGADKSVRLWDLASGQAVVITKDIPNPVTAIAWNAAGTQVAAGFSDGGIALFKADVAEPPLEKALAGNTQAITGLAYAPGGEAVYSAASDGNVRRYQVADGAQQWAQAHGAAIHDLALSADGQFLATAGENNQVKIWQAANGAGGPKPVLEGFSAPVRSVTFTLDNTKVVSGTANNQLVVHDAKTGLLEEIAVRHGGAVEAVASAGETGRQIISSSADKTVVSAPLAFERQLAGHGGPVNAVAIVPPQGARVASGSEDGTVRLWDLANGNQAASLAQGAAVTSLAVSSTGTRILSGGVNNTAILWNAANNQQVVQLKGDKRLARRVYHLEADEAEAKATLNAATAAVPAAEKSLGERTEAQKKATEAKAAAEKKATEMAADAKAKADAKVVTDKAFADADAAAKVAVEEKTKADKALTDSDAAQKAAVQKQAQAQEALNKDANNEDLKKAKADADTALAKANEELKKAQDAKAAADKKMADTAAALKTAQDAKTAADKAATDAQANAKKADDEKNAAVKSLEQADKGVKEATDALAKSKVDLEQRTAQQKAAEAVLTDGKAKNTEKEKPVRSVAFSRDGKLAAIGTESGQIATFDAETGAALEVLDAHGSPVRALAFGDIHTLVSGGDDQAAKVWDLNPAWKLAGVLGPKKETPDDLANSTLVHRITSLAFSNDGKLLATGGGDPSRSGELILWDVASQAVVKNLETAHSDTVFALQFSRDDKQILSGAADKFVKIHDVATGKLVKSFEGHTNHVLGVSWRGDMKQVASAGADNAIKVWNVETGEQLRTIAGYAKQVTAIQYMGRGGNFVSCGGDKTVRFHTADNGSNVRNFPGAADYMYAAAASERETIVIAAGQDGVLRVWNGANGQALRTFDPPKPPQEQATAK